ncbi:hypothetical protein [Luteolibacter soli]|uniref:Uncharacterized protein n=1 Tax=Luteolibacter soli TaxID=3135280 RepID=A0ABU9AVS9_9BACT
MPPLFRHSARLSIIAGVLSNLAAIAFTAAYLLQVRPGEPYRLEFLHLGLSQISIFALFAGGIPAVIAWIHPATSRLAKIGMLSSILPYFTGLATMIITP